MVAAVPIRSYATLSVSLNEQAASNALAEHEKSRNHPDATLKEKGFVQLSSATDSASETAAATPKAVKAANDNASSRLKASENLSDLADINKAREVLKLDRVGNWMAVQANGGQRSSGNHQIFIDWGADGKPHLTVDASYIGELFTTGNPPNAAQTGAYPKSGGYLNEGAGFCVINGNTNPKAGDYVSSPAVRASIKGRGAHGVADGASAWFQIVEHVGTQAYAQIVWNGFGSAHNFLFEQGGDFRIDGTYKFAGGAGWIATDGNIYGSIWGGYLSNWINGQLDNVNNSINSVRDTANDAWNKANDAQLNRVSAVRLGAERVQASTNDSGGIVSLGNGEMLTGAQGVGGSDFNKAYWRARAIQYFINGQWVQAGSI